MASSPEDHAYSFSVCPFTFVLVTEKSRLMKRSGPKQPLLPQSQASICPLPSPKAIFHLHPWLYSFLSDAPIHSFLTSWHSACTRDPQHLWYPPLKPPLLIPLPAWPSTRSVQAKSIFGFLSEDHRQDWLGPPAPQKHLLPVLILLRRCSQPLAKEGRVVTNLRIIIFYPLS